MQATRVLIFRLMRPASWARLGALSVLAALTFVLAGDSVRAALPANSGIDPLEILKLQVRPNVIIVLDSSGSMRQRPDATSTDNGYYRSPFGTAVAPIPAAVPAATVGDDHDSKLWNAKDVIKTIVTDNEAKVNFMFGDYTADSTAFGPEPSAITNSPATFLYTVKCPAADATCQTNAAAISIQPTYASGTLTFGNSGLRRDPAVDVYTEANGDKTYYLESNKFYNGVTVNVRSTGACETTVTCVTNTAKANPAPVRVQMRTSTGGLSGTAVTFKFQGVRWNVGNDSASNGTSSVSCGGFQALVPLQSCTNTNQLSLFNPYLADEVIKDPTTGDIVGYNPATDPVTKLATLTGGIRASGATPISASLDNIRSTFNTTIWPNRPNANQRTFVIFITDGDDTCRSHLQAAYSAQQLYNAGASDVTQQVPTYVVVFGKGATVNQANQIAYGGTGMTAVPTSGSTWNRDATVAEVAGCATCRPAYTAASAAELSTAVQAAIDQAVSSGEFSDQQSITESVYELGSTLTPPVDPLDPNTRYNATIPVLLQSTFELPSFAGHLKAFQNNGVGGSSLLWDAGAKLCERVTGYKAKAGVVPGVCDIGGVMATGPDTPSTAMGAGSYIFSSTTGDSLTGPANDPDTIATTAGARIRRRIFTTSQNGVNPNYTPANLVAGTAAWNSGGRNATAVQVPLWPPDPSVNPPKSGSSYAPGSLDTPLGVTTFTAAQFAAIGACEGTADSGSGAVPSNCRTNGLLQKEAREAILAFTAGAQVVRGTDGKPVRDATTGYIKYKARTWILAESTLAAPGIVSTPLQNRVAVHDAEYTVYREGPRTNAKAAVNGIASGFGLRNPDKDGRTASKDDANLKPLMSVVYHGTNHMLHAFRAGPCPASVSGCGGETGGEELWAYVPYDQLGKLYLRMANGQSRTKPIYVIAAPVRFADVFVPGSFSRSIGGVSVTGTGVWRTVLIVGRGAGGKSITAIDVTVPGPFTRRSNLTSTPVVVWNRGNPDTSDGLVKAGSNVYNNTTAAGSRDYTAYLKMGETWSVPAIGYVTAANNVTTRKPSGVEFAAWMGSGYSDVTTEGKTFYAIDVLTGDIIGANSQAAFTVSDGTAARPTYNALVARVAAYAVKPLSFYDLSPTASNAVVNPITEKVTAVYFSDVKGRVYKFLPDSPTVAPTVFRDLSSDGNQPVANAVALIAFDSDTTGVKPHVFVESGNDQNVPLPTASPFFRMYGLRDDAGTATDVFSPVDFPSGYRGTVQPATVFNSNGKARVFFAGTRFNPLGANCASSFDSVLFALEGGTGQAAYDLSSGSEDRSVEITNQRVNAVQTAGGQLVTDFGLGAQNAPPPPAPPAVTAAGSATQANVFMGSSVPGTIAYKVGSSVCR